MSQFAVIYDACVLFPAPLRDFLMRLALRDLYRARWSEQTLDEMQRAIEKQRSDIPPERLAKMRLLMNSNIRDAVVQGYESLIPALELPDMNDRHVLAAAIRGNAQIILTFNLKDFPSEKTSQYGIEAQHPDDFSHPSL